MKDYVIYIDTDSLFIAIRDFIKNTIGTDKWDQIDYKKRVEYILRISEVISDYVNERVFNETQLLDYNSQIKDFKISFKQEIVARNILFSKKKKYAYWMVNKEGIDKDNIEVTGLEIVRSDSSERVREMLMDIMVDILKGHDNELLRKKINSYRTELTKVVPEEICVNIGVKDAAKYIVNDKGMLKTTKGAPFSVKGIVAHNNLLNKLGLKDERIAGTGEKVKVVYLKKNIYGYTSFAFYRWLPQFDNHIKIDYNKMIETFFINKIKMLLEPAGMLELLENNDIMSFFQ